MSPNLSLELTAIYFLWLNWAFPQGSIIALSFWISQYTLQYTLKTEKHIHYN